jgi:hypothetical protein
MSLFKLVSYFTIYYFFGCSITFNVFLFNLLLNTNDNSNNPFINVIYLLYNLFNLLSQMILIRLSNNVIGNQIIFIYNYLNSKYLSMFTPKPVIKRGLNNTEQINSFLNNLDNMT